MWRKSSRSSQNGGCVEMTLLAAVMGVRGSKNLDGLRLELSREAFADLLGLVRSGILDL